MTKRNSRLIRLNSELINLLSDWQRKASSTGINFHNTDIQEIIARHLRNFDLKIDVKPIPKSREKQVTFKFLPDKRRKGNE